MTSAAGTGPGASPAERYAAARRRAEQARTPLGGFRDQYPFELDPFQVRACEALQEGRGVRVGDAERHGGTEREESAAGSP